MACRRCRGVFVTSSQHVSFKCQHLPSSLRSSATNSSEQPRGARATERPCHHQPQVQPLFVVGVIIQPLDPMGEYQWCHREYHLGTRQLHSWNVNMFRRCVWNTLFYLEAWWKPTNVLNLGSQTNFIYFSMVSSFEFLQFPSFALHVCARIFQGAWLLGWPVSRWSVNVGDLWNEWSVWSFSFIGWIRWGVLTLQAASDTCFNADATDILRFSFSPSCASARDYSYTAFTFMAAASL